MRSRDDRAEENAAPAPVRRGSGEGQDQDESDRREGVLREEASGEGEREDGRPRPVCRRPPRSSAPRAAP